MEFIHTADWHILDTQYGKKFRGEDFKEAIRQIVDYAIKNGIKYIINSGDILDRNRPSETMLDFLLELHIELKAAGITMFSITGNHDASNPSFLTFPGRQDNDASGGIVCIDNKVIEVEGLVIAGYPAIPWQLVHEDVEKMERKPDIIVWHGAIKEMQPFGVDLSIEDVWKTDFRLGVLAGDLHIHKSIRDERGRIFTYPGSVELTKQDHQKEKFFDLYTLDKPAAELTKLPDPLAVPIDTRTVLFLQCAHEDQVSECVAKAKQACDKNPDKPPMIFMRYNWAFRDVIPRILAVIDPTQTIFRYRILSPNFGNPNYREEEGAERQLRRPELANVVDSLVTPTDPLNGLVRALVNPDADCRTMIAMMVGDELRLLGVNLNQEPQ